MSKHIPPTAAKGKFPYPHRDLRQVAYDTWRRTGQHWGVSLADWMEHYHG